MRSYRPYYVRAQSPLTGVPMILFLCVSIKEIVELGRDFPWPRPASCPGCGSGRVWGHGFVGALFDGVPQQVLLRRWRCPDCRCVMRVRPSGYFTRIQAPIDSIRSSIACRLKTGKWPAGTSRSRQGHWLRSLYRNIQAHLNRQWNAGPIAGFERLMQKGMIPVSRSIECALLIKSETPYRTVSFPRSWFSFKRRGNTKQEGYG